LLKSSTGKVFLRTLGALGRAKPCTGYSPTSDTSRHSSTTEDPASSRHRVFGTRQVNGSGCPRNSSVSADVKLTQWVRFKSALTFKPLVSKDLFDRAQALLRVRGHKYPMGDEEMLKLLRDLGQNRRVSAAEIDAHQEMLCNYFSAALWQPGACIRACRSSGSTRLCLRRPQSTVAKP